MFDERFKTYRKNCGRCDSVKSKNVNHNRSDRNCDRAAVIFGKTDYKVRFITLGVFIRRHDKMKKIVFATIPMQEIKEGIVYKSEENKAIEYEKPVLFTVDSLLAKTLEKGDEVKIVRIVTEGKFSDDNLKLQKDELDKINSEIKADISYVEVREAFRETNQVLHSRFRQLVNSLETGCEIYTDMTFGPKTLTPVLFYVLGFAEKFFDADIKNIVYGKVDFDKNKHPVPDTAEIFDVTSLYYLNSMASVMKAPDGASALAMLNTLFEL